MILLADDLGVDMIGAYGEGADPPPTPNIDALAAAGVLFRNAYANPVCAATRSAMLTGRYGFRTGIGAQKGTLALAEQTLPEAIASSHLSAAVGKWHLHLEGDMDHPIDSGFAYYAGAILGGVESYYSWTKTTNSMSGPGSVETVSAYAATDTVNEAIAKIAEFGVAPWLLYVAFNAPHFPWHEPPAHLFTMEIPSPFDVTAKYKVAIEAMDTKIGRLLASIPQEILAETTIIFLGDNGTVPIGSEPPFDPERAKGTVYEGGTNVPLIVTSPRISASDEGCESLALVNASDIFATVLHALGGRNTAEDSVSLIPYLLQPSLPTLATRPYAYSEIFGPPEAPLGGPYESEHRMLRDARYKVIWRNGAYEEFFDLEADPWEQTNLLLSGMNGAETAAYASLVTAMEQLHDPGRSECDNGRDDDEDGRIDWAGGIGGAAADLGCHPAASQREDPECQDGIDNDGQRGTDFDGGESVLGVGNGDPAGPDPQCTYAWQNREARLRWQCGLGYELALLLPALMWLHRRRRRMRA